MSDSPPPVDRERTEALISRVRSLSASQFGTIEDIITQFSRWHHFQREPSSDLVSECVLREFGDILRIHHCFSAEAFTKDKFEYAIVKACSFCGVAAKLASRGNPGHDLTIKGVQFSLKTQANVGIKSAKIHISKFMELGRGQWGEKIEDLEGLRERFFAHMENYARILTLRRLVDPGFHLYELVEIPKSLFLEAKNGTLSMMFASKQFPKPGSCTVADKFGSTRFQLYFDGGTERKLQIRAIDKRLCTVHAVWRFKDLGTSEDRVLDSGVNSF